MVSVAPWEAIAPNMMSFLVVFMTVFSMGI